MRRWIVSLVLVAALSAPSAAFEGLMVGLGSIPADPSVEGPVFVYSSPRPNVGATLFPGDPDLAGAILAPADALRMTGVDFTRIFGVLETGIPPDQVVMLIGSLGFTGQALEVLTARGFEALPMAGTPVLTDGRGDGETDLGDRVHGDPFSGSLGRSYRLAIGEPVTIVTYSRQQMWDRLTALARDECPACRPWQDLVASMRFHAGTASLEGATGFGAATFARSADLPDLGAERTQVPPFLLAILAVTRTEAGQASAMLGVRFPDEESASLAGETLLQLLGRQVSEGQRHGLPPHAGITGGLYPDYGEANLIFSVDFADPNAAVAVYRQWIDAVSRRDFPPLALHR